MGRFQFAMYVLMLPLAAVCLSGATVAQTLIKKKAPLVVLLPGASNINFAKRVALREVHQMARKLKRSGYRALVVDYDNDLDRPRESMERNARRLLRQVAEREPQQFVVVGHSMGHYIGLAAILKEGLSGRISQLIGLAGAARGGEGSPFGCNNCPGIEGLVMGKEDYVVDVMLDEYRDEFEELQKCAFASSRDKFMKPFDSGFLPGAKNFVIDYAGHMNIPGHRYTIGMLQRHCGL